MSSAIEFRRCLTVELCRSSSIEVVITRFAPLAPELLTVSGLHPCAPGGPGGEGQRMPRERSKTLSDVFQ
jgi:hypothetical protein